MTMHYEKDADGIVTVTMDMSGPVNAMNEEFRNDFGDVVGYRSTRKGRNAFRYTDETGIEDLGPARGRGRADGRGDRLGQEGFLRRR